MGRPRGEPLPGLRHPPLRAPATEKERDRIGVLRQTLPVATSSQPGGRAADDGHALFLDKANAGNERWVAPAASPRDTPVSGERATSAITGADTIVRRRAGLVNWKTASRW